MSKFKIGDKVVPLTKFYGSLDHSVTWKEAQRIKQPFLWVNEVEVEGKDIITCGFRQFSGDYFKETDLIPYVEFKEGDLIPYVEFKEGDLVYVSDISLNDAFQSKRERIYMGKVKDVYFCLEENEKRYTEDCYLIKWKYIVPIPPKIESISMRLNDDYVSIVYKDRIVVGCTTVSREKVEEVLENMKLLSKD